MYEDISFFPGNRCNPQNTEHRLGMSLHGQFAATVQQSIMHIRDHADERVLPEPAEVRIRTVYRRPTGCQMSLHRTGEDKPSCCQKIMDLLAACFGKQTNTFVSVLSTSPQAESEYFTFTANEYEREPGKAISDWLSALDHPVGREPELSLDTAVDKHVGMAKKSLLDNVLKDIDSVTSQARDELAGVMAKWWILSNDEMIIKGQYSEKIFDTFTKNNAVALAEIFTIEIMHLLKAAAKGSEPQVLSSVSAQEQLEFMISLNNALSPWNPSRQHWINV